MTTRLEDGQDDPGFERDGRSLLVVLRPGGDFLRPPRALRGGPPGGVAPAPVPRAARPGPPRPLPAAAVIALPLHWAAPRIAPRPTAPTGPRPPPARRRRPRRARPPPAIPRWNRPPSRPGPSEPSAGAASRSAPDSASRSTPGSAPSAVPSTPPAAAGRRRAHPEPSRRLGRVPCPRPRARRRGRCNRTMICHVVPLTEWNADPGGTLFPALGPRDRRAVQRVLEVRWDDGAGLRDCPDVGGGGRRLCVTRPAEACRRAERRRGLHRRGGGLRRGRELGVRVAGEAEAGHGPGDLAAGEVATVLPGDDLAHLLDGIAAAADGNGLTRDGLEA